jgi:hypothetical protein
MRHEGLMLTLGRREEWNRGAAGGELSHRA